MARVTKKSEMLTVSKAAEVLGVSADTIRRWHKKGLISATVGSHQERLFSLDELGRVAKRNSSSDVEWKVLRAPKTDLTSIELFAGAGGLALGMHNAGIKSQLLIDNDKSAVETLRLNFPKTISQCVSVADVDLSKYASKIDVMAGGFPCQAFSYAGMKRGFEDARGTLFYEYARLINQVKPKLILGENVRGLLSHDDGRTLSTMIDILEGLGYRVAFKVLRAQFLDVAQKRERLIIFGLRNDQKANIVFPQEKDYTISLASALKDVPKSDGLSYNEKKAQVLALVPQGGYWRDLPLDIQKKFMGASFHLGGGKTGMARRLSWDEPSLTLTCSPAQKQTERCHPDETRPLTVREYARIQCFPDDFIFYGSVASQYKQIGNAVPVNLGYHVGLAIRTMLGKPTRAAERMPMFS
jgi:DNA (cytosine-5)-methyltransferase 1